MSYVVDGCFFILSIPISACRNMGKAFITFCIFVLGTHVYIHVYTVLELRTFTGCKGSFPSICVLVLWFTLKKSEHLIERQQFAPYDISF